ncbi:MAG: LEA type 2 family protein [Thermodesulfobacteriota bacterium]|nr:LEA type 2 family protein [Thermodesulfobacteriota bacterium]
MKRFVLFFFIGCSFFLPSCLSWFLEKPTFALKEIEVRNISLKEIDFLFGIEVQNPNNFDLKLRALEYTVYFYDQEVGKGRLEKEIKIANSSSALVQIPLQADLKSLGNPLGLLLAGKDLRYKIEGAAIIKTSLGSAIIPFSKSGEIKLN